LVCQVVMFFWALSSLFTKNFLRFGLQLSYLGIVSAACSFLAVCVFAAWYDDVWVQFAEFHNDGTTTDLGWGYFIVIAMIVVALITFAASLSLAAKEGDNTTQAAVTRNWGDAPFSGKTGMAESAAGGAGPAVAPRPSVPDRPNPNRGAPAVAPRPAGGWFNKGPSKPKLAPGWTEVKSQSGDVYYWNSTTNESTWETPLASASPAAPPRPAAPVSRGPPARQGSGTGPQLTRQGSGRSTKPPSSGAVEI